MTKITPSLFLAALLALGLHAASAQAQLVRTCVSLAKGSDANASSQCHCSTPCRTFATAATNTLADGEITVLDPGDYGGLTITRSISINNDSGGEASITVSGTTTGIIVSATAASYVNLRGITIQGVGFGTTTGLRFNSGFSLTMTNCVVRNHTGTGIDFRPLASSILAVSNTIVADNGADGIHVQVSGPGDSKVVLSRVEAHNNSANGIFVGGPAGVSGSVNATATDSVAAGNGSNGFRVASGGGGSGVASLMITRSVAANNAFGLGANGPSATLRVGQSTITGNTTGLSAASGASILSYGDNNIDGNGAGTETPTGPIAKK
jgi:Right handed beta helix region